MPLVQLVALCFFALFFYALTHLVIFRFLQPIEKWRAIQRSFLVFLVWIGFFVFTFYRPQTSAPTPFLIELGACVLLVWLYHIGYLTFYAFIDRSITLRLFIELRKAGGSLPQNELRKRYNPELAYQRRLDILVKSGYLTKVSDSQFQLTPKGRAIGRLVRFLKSLYKLGPGG